MARLRAAFGLRAHSGWAVLVTVAGAASSPALVDRRRVELADHAPAQPYHQAATLGDLASAAELIERARRDAQARARAAISSAIAEAETRGCNVRGAVLLASRARPLPSLSAVLASHPLLHTAEGELFRQALADACAHHHVALGRCAERDIYEETSRVLGIAPAALRGRLTTMGRSMGPPWTADHKAAFLAGWSLLAL